MADEETPQTPAPPATQATALWRGLSGGQRMVAIGALVALLGVLGWAMARDTGAAHGVLFSGLTTEDAGRIVQELQARKVPYEVENGGSAITVPESQVHELRLILSADGVSPSGGGVGFELFDKQAFGTTSFVERMNFRRALEGELSRTIMSLSTVDRARVHIAMGKRSLYSRDNDPPTASVVLSLRGGQQLSRAQRRGIVNMVASSVDGLDPAQVTLVDGNGNALSTPDADGVGPDGAMDMERTLAQRVEHMLEALVGQGNVAVTVTAELDRAHIERTEETYDQAPENKIVRRESREVRGGGGKPGAANVGGPAGARANLPGTAGGGGGGGGGDPSHLSETKAYEVNHVVSKTTGPKLRVKRLHLAVLVDEARDEEGNPISRSADELARIASIAREAAGLDEERGDKIEVHSVPFVREELPEADEVIEEVAAPAEIPRLYLAAAGAAAFVLFVIFFLILRRRRRSEPAAEVATTLPMTVEELQADLPEDELAELERARAGRALEELPDDATPLDRACVAVAGDTELAARVLRAWLTEGAGEDAANDEAYDKAA